MTKKTKNVIFPLLYFGMYVIILLIKIKSYSLMLNRGMIKKYILY